MTLVKKTKERREVRLVEDLLWVITTIVPVLLADCLVLCVDIANLVMILFQRRAGDLPHADSLERIKTGHCVISLNLLTTTGVLCTLDVEVRLESIDSHACDRLVAQASEDVDHILTTHIMFVPI